jgi:hypothetical protein
VIGDRGEELAAFCAKRFAKPLENPQAHFNGRRADLTDEEVIALARSAKNAVKFGALWDGHSGGHASHSEADQALVSMLAFYTQDGSQLDSLFRRSGLCREKWINRPDYRRSTIEKALSGLSETYSPSDDGARMVIGNRQAEASSQRPAPIGVGTPGRRPRAMRFSAMQTPKPRRYVLKNLVLASYVTLVHGDGGVAKSLLALALAVAVSGGSERWLGQDVENCPVLYLDFELDAEEQGRRVRQLCRAEGLAEPPDGLLYMSALGFTAREAFGAALEACEEHGAGLVVLDSLGPALQGDAEASKDVISFFQRVMEPFRAKGVAVLIIDHQSKLQSGQSYQGKSAFGSVYKANLARSVVQVEATERGEGALTLRVRQKKHNFGPLAEPFGVKLSFSEEAVELEALELSASELAEEGTLTAAERVKLALEDGPAYPWEISEGTGVPLKTVKNALTGLRKQGVAEPTGETEGRTERVRLCVPASRPYKRTGRRDDGDVLAGVLVNEQGEAVL